MRMRVAILALLALLFGSPAHAAPITVLAAASLTESLSRVAAAWTANGHPAVILSFDSSSKLAKQVEAGAPADVYFAADSAWMDYLASRALVDRATRVDLVGNRLVAVVPAGSALLIGAAPDLVRVQHLALAGESVPAGRYARAALGTLGVWEAVKARVVIGDNVRTVLTWVAAGEAEAGVVYATDARIDPKVKVAFGFPEASHPPIVYPAAVIRASSHAEDAGAFLAYCASGEGMAVFVAAGFLPLR
jgi:molybdate transport system substrate-binding protein